jgi:hypothetical protein
MQQHLQILINLLTQNNFKAALQHYLDSSEAENIDQLAFTFQQGNLKIANFESYQQVATKFIKSKALPEALITRIRTNDTLSFFTPALQLEENFSKTNEQQRNVLHSLLEGNVTVTSNDQPPFNYLRSLMLFERNDILCAALCQRDSQNLTPVETYLFTNSNLTDLADHELSALFALIEIERKQQAVSDASEASNTNYGKITQVVQRLCDEQKFLKSSGLQRLLLIATYYNKTIEQVLKDMQ